MIECIMNFTDFCPKDRVYFILYSLLIFFIGYIVGTDGHWKRFYWRKEKGEIK